MLKLTDWNIENITGYKPKTTFYMDLSIADGYGPDAVVDTYVRVFDEWKDSVEYITEFTMALNWKIWEHYETKPELAKLYNQLWIRADNWCMDNLEGDDLTYYLRTTD